jgi:hypothetical protein
MQREEGGRLGVTRFAADLGPVPAGPMDGDGRARVAAALAEIKSMPRADGAAWLRETEIYAYVWLSLCHRLGADPDEASAECEVGGPDAWPKGPQPLLAKFNSAVEWLRGKTGWPADMAGAGPYFARAAARRAAQLWGQTNQTANGGTK